MHGAAPVADTLRRAYAALVVSCNPLQYQPLLALSLEQVGLLPLTSDL